MDDFCSNHQAAAGNNAFPERLRPAWLEINLDNLIWNIRVIRGMTDAGAKICASMKSNAYGHGAARVAAAALENGADSLSVAFLDEALELRASGVKAPILILGVLERPGAGEIISNDITQTICSLSDAEALSAEAVRQNKTARVHIKIDTGMGRLGFICDSPNTYDDVTAACALPGICAEGLFTHFSTADEPDASYAKRQLAAFYEIYAALTRRGIRLQCLHCSNSAAISGFQAAHLDMVRPGIALYGGVGKLPGLHHRDMPLRRVMSLRTKVAFMKTVPAGSNIGYGRRFTARRTSVIITLPVGYGDGYCRGLSCGVGEVLVNGRRAPIAGMICMDQCMADATDIGGVKVGDEAVLFGKQGDDEITLEEVSAKLNTIPYEIMCSISRRVPRLYTLGDKPAGYINYLASTGIINM